MQPKICFAYMQIKQENPPEIYLFHMRYASMLHTSGHNGS